MVLERLAAIETVQVEVVIQPLTYWVLSWAATVRMVGSNLVQTSTVGQLILVQLRLELPTELMSKPLGLTTVEVIVSSIAVKGCYWYLPAVKSEVLIKLCLDVIGNLVESTDLNYSLGTN